MKFNNIDQAVIDKAKEILEKSDDKSNAIIEVAQMLISEKYDNLIKEVVAEANQANANNASNTKLGLRTLSNEENKFYDLLKKDVKQAITGSQIDLIPNTIVDNTLADIKKQSDLLSLCKFAPADVKKWLVASKTGTFAWGELNGAIDGELNAAFTSLNIELGKLTAYLIIPKAIRDLANPFVDKYFNAILGDVMHDKVRNGGNGDAELTEVRERAGATLDVTATLETLLEERLREFAWEGLRRQDLVRFGKFTRAYTDRPQLPKEDTGYTTVFPIHEDVLSLNGKLTQNYGY